MTHLGRVGHVLLLLLVAGLAACSSVTSPSVSSSPFFVPDPREAPRFQTLSRDQDSVLASCAESHTCDRAHFTRALLALYEDQSVAAKHFKNVIEVAPKSRLAASSQFWLFLLDDPPNYWSRGRTFTEATERLVRDLVEMEALSLQVLQRELKARDAELKLRDAELKLREKKMDELTQQLDALKRIDQEMKEKSRPRPSNK